MGSLSAALAALTHNYPSVTVVICCLAGLFGSYS